MTLNSIRHILPHAPLRLAVLAVLVAPAVTAAHGIQIPVDVVDGRVVTRSFFGDYEDDGLNTPGDPKAADQPLDRSHVIVLSDIAGGWSRPSPGGGLVVVPDRFASSTKLVIELADELKFWNGATFVDAGVEQVRLQNATGNVVTTDAPGPGPRLDHIVVNNAAGQHASLTWSLLGDGTNNVGEADGVYLVSFNVRNLEASGAATGVGASATTYALVEKNATALESPAALAYVDAVLVPEPTAGEAVAVALGGAMMSRRRWTHGRAVRPA